MGRVGALNVLLIAVITGSVHAQESWYRGNVHVHTDRSDGGSPPVEVVEWYRTHEYDFVMLTDHDLQSVTADLVTRFHTPGAFLLLPGVEVTDRVEGHPVHLNGLGVRDAVVPQGGVNVSDAIRRNALAIEDADGVAVLNHPNGLLSAALSATDIHASGITLFEVCCSDFLGGSGHPSTDEIWDSVLTQGQVLFGIAADDAHDFGPDSRDAGSAWVMVRSSELSGPAILDALRRGDFYSTTGVILEEVVPSSDRLCLRIGQYAAYGFRTEFIGSSGRLLHTDESAEPCFAASYPQEYIRARVRRSDGAWAWVQPVFLSGGV